MLQSRVVLHREHVTLGSLTGAIPKISELLNKLNRFGGKVYACVSAMALHNIMEDELTEEVNGVTGITTFLESGRCFDDALRVVSFVPLFSYLIRKRNCILT